MELEHGHDTYLAVEDGSGTLQDISACLKQTGLLRDREVTDASLFGARARAKKGGVPDAKIPFDGWFDADFASRMDAALGHQEPLGFIYDPAQTPLYRYSGTCLLAKWNVEMSPADMVHAWGEFAVTGAITQELGIDGGGPGGMMSAVLDGGTPDSTFEDGIDGGAV